MNDAFTLLWLADVGAWWAVGADYPRRFRRISPADQTAFAFLMFNATVVFGPAHRRPIIAALALLLACGLLRRIGRRPRPQEPSRSTQPRSSARPRMRGAGVDGRVVFAIRATAEGDSWTRDR